MKAVSAAALLVAATLSGCAARPDRDALRFDGDYGPLALDVDWAAGRFTGDYPKYEGRIAGTATRAADGGVLLAGTWSQPRSDRRCGVERDGRWFWGRFVLVRDAGAPARASWGYCEDPPGNDWPLAAR